MMVGSNLNDVQLQQIVDKTILEADVDKDGKISFDEFVKVCGKAEIHLIFFVSVFFALFMFACLLFILLTLYLAADFNFVVFFASQMISNTDEIDQKLTFSLDAPAQV